MQLQLDELPTAIGESRTSEPSSAVAATHFLVLKDDSKYINDSIVSSNMLASRADKSFRASGTSKETGWETVGQKKPWCYAWMSMEVRK